MTSISKKIKSDDRSESIKRKIKLIKRSAHGFRNVKTSSSFYSCNMKGANVLR